MSVFLNPWTFARRTPETKMKIVIILAAVVAVALAEPCRTDSDCVQHAITTCSHQTHVVCHDHQCECTNGPSGQTCSSLADCNSVHCDHGGHRHCIDGNCHCTRN